MRLCLLLALVVSAPALAQEVPESIPHQGRLLQDGAPLNGARSVRFALYRTETGGAPVWSETTSVTFTEGYYAVSLGSTTPIAPNVADGSALWLGVRVGADDELPRVRTGSVPYALRAGVAANVTGDITPSSISVGGVTVINGSGAWVGSTSGLEGPQGPPGPAGPQGPAGSSADPSAVATQLGTNTTFIGSVSGNLAANHASTLRGPQGEVGPPGSPDSGDDILAKLRQVDGSGSGLDADTVDGLSAQEIADLVQAESIQGAADAIALKVRGVGSGGGTRSIRVAGVEAIDFSNSAGLAMVVVERDTYDLPAAVNNVGVRRNFDVNNTSTGQAAWGSFMDAVTSNLTYTDHIVILASNGPIDRFMWTELPGGNTPADVLNSLGADLSFGDLSATDALSLIGYPSVGRGNGLSVVVDATASGTPSAEIAAIVFDGTISGADQSRRSGCPADWVNIGPTCVAPSPGPASNYPGAVLHCFDQNARLCDASEHLVMCERRDALGLNYPDNTWIYNGERSWERYSGNTYPTHHINRRVGNKCWDNTTTASPSNQVVSWAHGTTATYLPWCCLDR